MSAVHIQSMEHCQEIQQKLNGRIPRPSEAFMGRNPPQTSKPWVQIFYTKRFGRVAFNHLTGEFVKQKDHPEPTAATTGIPGVNTYKAALEEYPQWQGHSEVFAKELEDQLINYGSCDICEICSKGMTRGAYEHIKSNEHCTELARMLKGNIPPAHVAMEFRNPETNQWLLWIQLFSGPDGEFAFNHLTGEMMRKPDAEDYGEKRRRLLPPNSGGGCFPQASEEDMVLMSKREKAWRDVREGKFPEGSDRIYIDIRARDIGKLVGVGRRNIHDIERKCWVDVFVPPKPKQPQHSESKAQPPREWQRVAIVILKCKLSRDWVAWALRRGAEEVYKVCHDAVVVGSSMDGPGPATTPTLVVRGNQRMGGVYYKLDSSHLLLEEHIARARQRNDGSVCRFKEALGKPVWATEDGRRVIFRRPCLASRDRVYAAADVRDISSVPGDAAVVWFSPSCDPEERDLAGHWNLSGAVVGRDVDGHPLVKGSPNRGLNQPFFSTVRADEYCSSDGMYFGVKFPHLPTKAWAIARKEAYVYRALKEEGENEKKWAHFKEDGEAHGRDLADHASEVGAATGGRWEVLTAPALPVVPNWLPAQRFRERSKELVEEWVTFLGNAGADFKLVEAYADWMLKGQDVEHRLGAPSEVPLRYHIEDLVQRLHCRRQEAIAAEIQKLDSASRIQLLEGLQAGKPFGEELSRLLDGFGAGPFDAPAVLKRFPKEVATLRAIEATRKRAASEIEAMEAPGGAAEARLPGKTAKKARNRHLDSRAIIYDPVVDTTTVTTARLEELANKLHDKLDELLVAQNDLDAAKKKLAAGKLRKVDEPAKRRQERGNVEKATAAVQDLKSDIRELREVYWRLLKADPIIATMAREESSAVANLHWRLEGPVTAREKDSDEDIGTDDDSDEDTGTEDDGRMEKRYAKAAARRCLVGDEADKVEAMSEARFRQLLKDPALKQVVSTNEKGTNWTDAQAGHCHFDVTCMSVPFRFQATLTEANSKTEAIRVLRRLQAFVLEHRKSYKTEQEAKDLSKGLKTMGLFFREILYHQLRTAEPPQLEDMMDKTRRSLRRSGLSSEAARREAHDAEALRDEATAAVAPSMAVVGDYWAPMPDRGILIWGETDGELYRYSSPTASPSRVERDPRPERDLERLEVLTKELARAGDGRVMANIIRELFTCSVDPEPLGVDFGGDDSSLSVEKALYVPLNVPRRLESRLRQLSQPPQGKHTQESRDAAKLLATWEGERRVAVVVKLVARRQQAANTLLGHVINRSLAQRRRAEGKEPYPAGKLYPVGSLTDQKLLGERYRERQLMNVCRGPMLGARPDSSDWQGEPTTRVLSRLLQLGAQRMQRGGFDTKEVGKAVLLNAHLWRQGGGTPLAAASIGFQRGLSRTNLDQVRRAVRRFRSMAAKTSLDLKETWESPYFVASWPQDQQQKVRQLVEDFLGDRVNRLTLDDFCTPGYKPSSLLHAHATHSQPGRFEKALKQVTKAAKVLFEHGHAEAVLEAAARGSWRDSCCALAGIPFYGEMSPGDWRRAPGFHAKELCSDALGSSFVFPEGRGAVWDGKLFSPSGPGCRKGLCVAWGLPRNTVLSHEAALRLMRAMWGPLMTMQEAPECPLSKDVTLQRVQDLQDLQYNLCELQKVSEEKNSWPRRGLEGHP